MMRTTCDNINNRVKENITSLWLCMRINDDQIYHLTMKSPFKFCYLLFSNQTTINPFWNHRKIEYDFKDNQSIWIQ